MKRPDGSRGLYVDPACRWTIAEYDSYQYPPATLAEGLRDGSDDGDDVRPEWPRRRALRLPIEE